MVEEAVLGAMVMCALVGSSPRQAAGQSPDAWRQLSLPDFVREIEQLTSAAEPVSDALWTEMRSQSTERLLQAVQSGGQADFGDLVSPPQPHAGANRYGAGRPENVF